MTQATTPSATTSLDQRLEALKSKYKPVTQLATRAVTATKAGTTPAVNSGAAQGELAKLFGEMGAIQAEMAVLADKSSKLGDQFKNSLGVDWKMTVPERFKMGLYKIMGNEKGMYAIRAEAGSRKGTAIEGLVNSIDNVMAKQHQNSLTRRDTAIEKKNDAVNHQRYLERSLIDSLGTGYTSEADKSAALAEVSKFSAEISSLDELLKGYEGQLNLAQSEQRLADVNAISVKMRETVEIKYGLFENKLGAEGVVSEIRRTMLDSAKGIETAKSSMLANEAVYHQANLLIDIFAMQEISYRHLREKMIPVFQGQAAMAALGMEAGQATDDVNKVLEISQRLNEVNTRMLKVVSENTYSSFARNTYERDASIATRDSAIETRQVLIANSEKYAELQRSITDIIAASPRYTVEVQK